MTTHYGWRARFGLGVPQANPTVEPEFRRLMPEGVECYVVRLTSNAQDAGKRIADYLTNLESHLERFGGLHLDGFGFAMTGSTYLLGSQTEHRIVATARTRFGYPIVTCCAAVDTALRRRDAQRLQLVTPYPAFLVEAARKYWEERGFVVVRTVDIPRPREDIRGIYDLSADVVLDALRSAPCNGVDAVVVSGTGLPTLAVLDKAQQLAGRPVLASNVCLADALLRLLPVSL